MPSERDYLLLLLGAALYVILMHQIPALRGLSDNKQIRIEDIAGIDISALNIARQKGLMY